MPNEWGTMAQVVWTPLDGDVWEGAVGGSTWFSVHPLGFSDYYGVTSSFPAPLRNQSIHGAQAGKDVCQAAVDAFTALLPALTAE